MAVKRPGRCVHYLYELSAEVKGRVRLYLHSCGRSWPALGWTIHLLLHKHVWEEITSNCWVTFYLLVCLVGVPMLATFINQLMHSIITAIDVKLYVIQKSKRHILKILQHVSDHMGSIIREWSPILVWNYAPPPRLWLKCNPLLKLGRLVGAVTLSRWEWWWNERWTEVPEGALNLISTNYLDHGHHGRLPFSRKNAHGRAGNRTRDLMVSSQELWPPSHEAGGLKLRIMVQFCLLCALSVYGGMFRTRGVLVLCAGLRTCSSQASTEHTHTTGPKLAAKHGPRT